MSKTEEIRSSVQAEREAAESHREAAAEAPPSPLGKSRQMFHENLARHHDENCRRLEERLAAAES